MKPRRKRGAVTAAGLALIALLMGACSSARPDNEGDAHNTSALGYEMQMHVFTCEDKSSIVTGLNADTFLIDVIGATGESRERLTAPRASVRAASRRLTVTVGNDLLHLERIGRQDLKEHLSFRGKSCWR